MGRKILATLLFAVLVASGFLSACYQGDDDPCSGVDLFVPLHTNKLMKLYSDEPEVRYLLTRPNGDNETLSFQTRLDTQYIETNGTLDCNYCWALYETVRLRFLNDSSSFNMKLVFTPCNYYDATIEGRLYTRQWPSNKSFLADTLNVNDSIGLYYFARDSQYQLTLLP